MPDADAVVDADADADAVVDDDAGAAADAAADPAARTPHDDWYRWGRVVLYAEMVIAVLVTAFSLYLAFTGRAGFLAH